MFIILIFFMSYWVSEMLISAAEVVSFSLRR
jgi:hypothetical protein